MGHTHPKINAINSLSQEIRPLCVEKRKQLLNSYRVKQPFRVSVGRRKWFQYEQFNPTYNLREILNDEIVIEFDNENRNLTWTAINFTAINLYRTGFDFEVWSHNGKSPHLHIHNLPIAHLEKDKLRLFKKVFIRKFVPKEYLEYVDYTLTGIHLIAIEWINHWKGCYDIKQLLSKFNPKENEQKN